MIQDLENAFLLRYPGDSGGLTKLRSSSIELCKAHLSAGLGDANLTQRLCSAEDTTFWQAISEVLIARQLQIAGLDLVHAATGPDFQVEVDGRRIWIEVICPTPVGIPADWLIREPGKVTSMPHESMLLRWTSAIKEKAEKLLGAASAPGKGYIASGLVDTRDAYVIAVNGRLLRGAFPALDGISTFPFAVEATFSVGPYAITTNKDTLETVDTGHQHRPRISKPNGAQVPADTFLDPRFAPISAIWATDMDENGLVDRHVPMAIVHNPLARVRIQTKVIPAEKEFVATSDGDFYRLDVVPGLLASPPTPPRPSPGSPSGSAR